MRKTHTNFHEKFTETIDQLLCPQICFMKVVAFWNVRIFWTYVDWYLAMGI